MHILRPFAACAALAVALAALTGAALAAPPEAPPGLETAAGLATAPGQEKTADEAAPAPAAQPAPAPAAESAPGQVKKTSTAVSSTKSSGINSTSSGVKPSSTTDKNQWTTAGANPDKSKRYGNGTTAAQIATSRGAAAATPMYGPGNSQPHMVCKKVNNGGKAVWTDHHAVKSYPTACEAAPSVQAPAVTRAPGLGPTTVTTAPAVAPAAAAAAAAAAASAAGGVAGVAATRPEAGGVAGVLAEIGGVAGAALPFTGFPLWAAVLLAISAISVGVALRRSGRPLTTPV